MSTAANVRVGYVFSAKKMKTLKPIVSECRDGVEFVNIDVTRPIEEQGHFDGILHKLSHDVVLEATNAEARSRLQFVEQLEKDHPSIVVIDPVSLVRRSVCRLELSKLLLRIDGGQGGCARFVLATPKFVAANGDSREMVSTMEQAEFDYPIICKPLHSCATPESHYLSLIMGPEGFEELHVGGCQNDKAAASLSSKTEGAKRDNEGVLLQEYVDHDAILIKMYVLGDRVEMALRPSLPNLQQTDPAAREDGSRTSSYHHEGFCNNNDGNGTTTSDHRPRLRHLQFDSQKPYPTMETLLALPSATSSPSPSSSSPGVCGEKRQPPPPPTPGGGGEIKYGLVPATATTVAGVPRDFLLSAAGRLRELLGLGLFGVDLIVESPGGGGVRRKRQRGGGSGGGDVEQHGDVRRVLVVDINVFPSYTEMADFPESLRSYIRGQVEKRRVELRQEQ